MTVYCHVIQVIDLSQKITAYMDILRFIQVIDLSQKITANMDILRFVQEIKIIFEYRDCLKNLRIVICNYKNLTRQF